MCSSGIWASDIPTQKAWDFRDIHGPNVTPRSELERHRGPILPEDKRSIGIVQGVQGYRWLTFTIHGKGAHTGTTPLSARHDPVLAVSRMIAASNDIAKRHGALASTGIIKVPPNASTDLLTVASEVTFTLDIGHPQDSVVHAVQGECLRSFAQISSHDGKGGR
ncbi:hypothetical protein N7474_006940 [Penicillium riverlandense]|uniref:uncharacterized protein n=1 Tax=Penicillium riverlandense TaxID=1903569 RepID=UPI00254943AD|nr:uncharacterized protein N7474_006940 [Penicillium riverlandense]KAJ5815163.1 hypothetical protein N7474_006940 [Penicillium riverlandense]